MNNIQAGGIVDISAEVEGFYRFTINSPRGNRECFAHPVDNIFTDFGLNRIGTERAQTFCHVGTGTAAAVASDVSLQTWVASTSTTVSLTSTAQNSAPYFSTYVIKFRFALGAVVGNMSEVGISEYSTNSGMLSRALIVDSNGSATSITVLVDEVLDVEYSFRVYPPTNDVVGNITLDGVSYAYTLRASYITDGTYSWNAAILFSGLGSPQYVHLALDGNIGSITAGPSGISSDMAPAALSYGNNNLYRDVTETVGLLAGNFAGFIKSMRFCYSIGMTYQIGFTPVIPKDATKVLTMTFRFSWARRP